MLIFLHLNQSLTDFQTASTFERVLFAASPVGVSVFAVVIFLIQKAKVIKNQFGTLSAFHYVVGNIP